ncbi:DUF5994 family protein [Streptomyces roseicoloratus]|uniref:DUF5994 family protein n=1 Tax=Streptomyces roseicoloratus TaxID=2508722 RepID=A0ABY9RVN9_9ACTN|nr:DUF5994 family protein [Streptomyces roseicoloratus]WMX46227.1 DUF5994 family protein [Streptomyces roseicoloratus]
MEVPGAPRTPPSRGRRSRRSLRRAARRRPGDGARPHDQHDRSHPPGTLALTPHTSLAGLLDGAWWPYSRDLTTELPPLVDALRGRCGRITRITANPGPWPVSPTRSPSADMPCTSAGSPNRTPTR